MKAVCIHFDNDRGYTFTMKNEQINRLIGAICDGINRQSYLRLTDPDVIINLNKVTYVEIDELKEMEEIKL